MGAPQVVAPLSLAERAQGLLQRTQYRRADTDEAREAIFRLRYEAYLREGAIKPSFARSFSDRYDDLDNAWNVGLYVDDQLCSAMRIHVGTQDVPEMVATDVFGEYVRPTLETGKVIVDPTRFVVDPQMARVYPELPYLTVRVGHMAAEHFAADVVLATVRAEHQAFYKRVFGHVVICPPREYPTLIKPLSLMMLDYPSERDRILRRYPFFASTQAERAVLYGEPPLNESRNLVPLRPATASRQLA
jgi:N-acyl-L-homoserine lactone synthetase